ncbi:MAG TPA: hypothetical protein VIP98_21730 [Microlunatus sp.]
MTRFLNLPGAPILLPRVAGTADPAAELRTAAQQAIRAVLPQRGRVIIITGSTRTRRWRADTPYDLGRLIGRTRVDQSPAAGPSIAKPGSDSLPLPLAVARGLFDVELERLQLITIADAADPVIERALDVDLDQDDLVVTVGDGSALGKPGGPDVVHPRAEEFDRSLTEAWQSGDPARLAELDADLAAAVLSNGSSVWRLAARIAGRQPEAVPYRCKINFSDAPFGVYYLIASWS